MNWKLIRIIDFCFGIPLIWCFRGLSFFKKPSEGDDNNQPVNKILLVKFWGIGNIFMLLPSIQAIQAAWSTAEIDFLTLENNRDALSITGTHNIITINTSSPLAFLTTFISSFKQLRQNHYDLIIDFEQFARFSTLMTHLAYARRAVGFDTRGQYRHNLYSCTVKYDNDIHITQSFYALTTAAGIEQPFSPVIHLNRIDNIRSKGRNLLAAHGIKQQELIVIMHIGTSDNFRERRWPPSYFAALADLLIERYNVWVIMTGLSDEAFLIADTICHLKKPERVLDLGGELSFTDYFALITIADLIISADTAAVHMASAVNTPVVGLYGPNTPHLYGPWGSHGLALYAQFDCSPCITNFNGKLNNCRHPDGRGACMSAISVATAFAAVEDNYLLPAAPWRLGKLKVSQL